MQPPRSASVAFCSSAFRIARTKRAAARGTSRAQCSRPFVVITDVCMCEYTSHGHCGILRDGGVDNDATLALLQKAALSHARAGADIVAPSDMMDGRVRAIRTALDTNGFEQTAILSYAA